MRGPEDFAIWYTPGVAAPCVEIAAMPERVFDHTNRGNLVAIVSDGRAAPRRCRRDVCIASSEPGPGVIRPDWVRAMAPDAIVLACANPTPEIWPWEAREAGAAIVASGRSDLPHQVSNSLAFPGIFRGALDVRVRAPARRGRCSTRWGARAW